MWGGRGAAGGGVQRLSWRKQNSGQAGTPRGRAERRCLQSWAGLSTGFGGPGPAGKVFLMIPRKGSCTGGEPPVTRRVQTEMGRWVCSQGRRPQGEVGPGSSPSGPW